jgi:hypothetical protein
LGDIPASFDSGAQPKIFRVMQMPKRLHLILSVRKAAVQFLNPSDNVALFVTL